MTIDKTFAPGSDMNSSLDGRNIFIDDISHKGAKRVTPIGVNYKLNLQENQTTRDQMMELTKPPSNNVMGGMSQSYGDAPV